MLRKAFDSQYKHRVEMVQMVSSPSEPGPVLVKLYIDPPKGISIYVLNPIPMTGTRSVDDKRELQIYYPSQNEKTIQPSPQKFRLSNDRRVQLVERNFALSLKDEGTKEADRDVYVLILKAKHRGVGDRYLFIDKEKFIIFRSVLKESPTKNFTLLQTSSANFSVPKKPKEFILPSGKSVHTTKKWGPVNLSDFKNANIKLGFAPRIPATIPHGFEITHKQVVGQEKKPILACRLSDGMNFITLYQWSPKVHDGESPFQNVKTFSDAYGIRYYAEGDAPRAILKQVGETFYLK